MRIYRKPEFLRLPPGTIYAKGEPWLFGAIAVKGETISDSDWFASFPVGIDSHNSGELFDRMEAMLTSAVSYPMNNVEERDGTFNPEDIFLVYETDDLLTLRYLIEQAIRALEAHEKGGMTNG